MVYGAADTVENATSEVLGDGVGSVVGGVTRVGTGLAGLATQGAGYVAGATTDAAIAVHENVGKPVYDNVLKPAGNVIADGYDATVDAVKSGIDAITPSQETLSKLNPVNWFGSDEEVKAPETPTAEVETPTVEEPTVAETPAPVAETPAPTAGDDVINTMNNAADAIYGAADTVKNATSEVLGDGVGSVVGGVTRVGTGLAGLATQGAGYAAGATTDAAIAVHENVGKPVYDNVLKPAGNVVADGYDATVDAVKSGIDAITPSKETLSKLNPVNWFSSDEEVKAPETPTAEVETPTVEEPTVAETPAPVAETPTPTAGEDVINTMNNAADAVYGAADTVQNATSEVLGDGVGSVVGGVTRVGTGLAGLATQGAGYAAGATTDAAIAVHENVGKPVYDNVLKPAGNVVADGYNATVDAIGDFAETGYHTTVDGLKKGYDAVVPTKEGVKTFFSKLNPVNWFGSDEEVKAPETPTAEVETPTVEEPTVAETPAPVAETPAPTAGEDVINTMNNAADAVYGAADTVQNATSEVLGDGVGSVVGGVTRVGTGLAGLATQGAGYAAGATTDAAIAVHENVGKPVYDNVLKPAGNVIADGYDATVETVKSGIDAITPSKETLSKLNPVNWFGSDEAVKVPEAQKEGVKSAPSRLETFLKEKGLSDADIKMAVELSKLEEKPVVEKNGLKDRLGKAQETPTGQKTTYTYNAEKAKGVNITIDALNRDASR